MNNNSLGKNHTSNKLNPTYKLSILLDKPYNYYLTKDDKIHHHKRDNLYRNFHYKFCKQHHIPNKYYQHLQGMFHQDKCCHKLLLPPLGKIHFYIQNNQNLHHLYTKHILHHKPDILHFLLYSIHPDKHHNLYFLNLSIHHTKHDRLDMFRLHLLDKITFL